MSGWVLLNSLTIWLSSVRVLPDHMVCQVMLATVPVPVDEEEVDVGAEDEDEAAVPPQPAAATTVTAASSTADLRLAILRCFLGLLPVTRCSFFFVCICLYVFLYARLSRRASGQGRWRPGACPHDQLGLRPRPPGRGGADQFLQRRERGPPEVDEVQADGGQRGRDELRLRDVVEADHADVARHRPSGLPQGPDDPEREIIVSAEHRGDRGVAGEELARLVARSRVPSGGDRRRHLRPRLLER